MEIISKIFHSQAKSANANTIKHEFIRTLLEKGIPKAQQLLEDQKKQKAANVLFTEAELNSLGYQFLYQQRRVKEAIEIFRLNVDAYPVSAKRI